MRKIISLFALIALVWPVATTFGQEIMVEQSDKLAQAGLSTFQDLVKQQKNYREMGFESVRDLDRITLGEPMRVFMVRLDELGKYEKSKDPNKLLHEAKRIYYPVQVDDKVRSSLTVSATAKGLAVSSFGSPNKIKLVARARENSIDATRLTAAQYFLVEVPGLKLVFVGYRVDSTLMLVPILDNSGFEFKARVAIEARDAFLRMVPAVPSHMEAPG